MDDRAGLEYLMSLIDEAERVIASDPLGEDREVVSYSFDDGGKGNADFHRSAVSCHDCDGYLSRTVFPRPILKKGSKVMFILSKPDGSMMLEGRRITDFRRWWHDSLLLNEGEWSLTSLIKCPVAQFSKASADACRRYIKGEMEEYAPESLVILGLDAARYMLRTDAAIDKLLQRCFHINHIPSFVSPSLDEYAATPSLRRAIWENFLFIRGSLGLDKRQS